METGYLRKQVFLLLNQLLVIVYLGYEYLHAQELEASDIFPMILISIIIADAIYIGCMNLKNSRMLSRFSLLLTLVAWYFLFILDRQGVFLILLSLAGAVIFYATIRFILAFFFQGFTYQFQKQTDLLLTISCLLTLCMKFVNDKWFALLFLIQMVLGTAVCIFLFIVHKKRILFVLKSERKNFLISAFVVITIFISYVLCFGKQQEYVAGLGAYLILFLPLSSIHSIALKNRKETTFAFLLNNSQIAILSACFVSCFVIIGILMKCTISEVFIIIHCILWFILLYFTLLYNRIKTSAFINIESFPAMQENSYIHTLVQIQKEENLKKDFSNYLHDEVLQDLLSIKNMMIKATRPEIRNIILQTLDNLNVSIREQMQEYHPVILKSLTIKENFQNLIEAVQKTYPTKKIHVAFDCDDKLFLVDPYNYIVYRILKELVTNSFKHSQASHLNITLTQENENIELIVQDDGAGISSKIRNDTHMHKGLDSIREQLASLSGSILTEPVTPSGLRVTVRIPMRGEDSYAYFVNR